MGRKTQRIILRSNKFLYAIQTFNVIIVWNRTDETANTLIMLIFVPDNIFESLEEPLPTKIPIRYRGPPGPYKSRPRVSNMVLTAIKEQKKRNGSSLPAIKKYIADKYKVDVAKLNPFIKRYIRTAVEQKVLIPVKASYKLSKKAKMK